MGPRPVGQFCATDTRTRPRLKEQIEESIKRYLDALDTADRTQPPTEFQGKAEHLHEKLRTMREQMRRMQDIEQRLKSEPSGQLTLPDPDARSMATSGRGSGIVGYDMQLAGDPLPDEFSRGPRLLPH